MEIPSVKEDSTERVLATLGQEEERFCFRRRAFQEEEGLALTGCPGLPQNVGLSEGKADSSWQSAKQGGSRLGEFSKQHFL